MQQFLQTLVSGLALGGPSAELREHESIRRSYLGY